MPRPQRYPEAYMTRYPAGTLRLIDGILEAGEDRAAFFRTAVDREIVVRKGFIRTAEAIRRANRGAERRERKPAATGD